MSQPFLFFRAYGFRIILVVVFLLSFIWLGTRMTLQSNSNNVEDWLPKSNKQTQIYKWFEKNFPAESFVIISWKDCKVATFDGMKHDEDKIELFARRLVPGQTINNMTDWFNPKPLVAEIDISRVQERLSPTEETADVPGDPTRMLAALTESVITAESLADETEPQDGSQKDYFKSVLTYPRLRKMLVDQSPGMTDDEVNQRLSGVLIGDDHASTALMAFLKKKPKGKEADEVIAYVRQIAQDLGIEPVREEAKRAWYQVAFDNFALMVREMLNGRQTDTSGVIIGGTPVDNASIAEEGTRTLFRLAGFCAVIGLGLAYLCFRSLRLTTFVFWTAILSAGISLATVSFTRSHCDTIMLSMPALVYILAMSASIHLINYYHDAIRESGLVGAPERAIQLGWFPCFIAALTTAFGLGSLYVSGLVPIQKFGVYSALGVMFTLVMIFLFLPAMLYFYPSKKYAQMYGGKGLETEEHDSRILQCWRFVGNFIINNSNKVALTCLVVMVLFGIGLYKIAPEVKMMKFYSKDAPIIVNYTWLEKQIGPLVPMEVVLKFDNAVCDLTTIQRLRLVDEVAYHLKSDHVEEVGGVMSAATFAPSPWPPEVRGLMAGLKRLGFDTIFNQKFDSGGRRMLRDYVTTELEGNPEIGKLDIPDNEITWLKANGVTHIAQLLSIPVDEGMNGIPAEVIAPYREIAQAWEKSHGIDLWRISVRVWALGGNKKSDGMESDNTDNIDYSLLIEKIEADIEALLTQENIKAIADPMGDNINNPTATEREIKGINVAYTGMVPLVYQTQHALINGLISSLILAFVTIALVFCFVLRNVRAGFLAMVPNVFPIMIVFGYMGWAGILIDVGTMMTASVAMGVAVDNTMHYLTWFRKGIDAGLKPRVAALQAYERCATAMTEMTVICGLGLSAFSFSTFTPTQMFGKMMLSILLVSMLGDLVFLPAILTGPFGKYFVRKQPAGKGGSSNKALPAFDDAANTLQENDRNFAAFNALEAEGVQFRHSQAAHSLVARPNVLSNHAFLMENDDFISSDRQR
ncbi:MAG: MMPL family transporter [Planctomycetaceae bacterium]|nr:MMPL family transporter [Planctomycetaceae bacterium]